MILLPLFFLFPGCRKEAAADLTLFTSLPPSVTGVDFENRLTESEEFNIIQYLYFNNGGGVAAGDINNDGLIDLYFTASQLPDRLYLNRGGFRFEDISEKAGIAGLEAGWSTGVTMADVNGDGLLDIYVCQVGNYRGLTGRNRLLMNQGDLTFRDEAEAYGLDFQGFSTQAAFFDYDADGDLDMYLLNHAVHTTRSYGGAELREESDARSGDRLFRNELSEGRAHFTDVTGEAGIYSSPIGYGLGVTISDITGDGYPDIYVSNDFHENDYLYVNNGDGTFTERLNEMIAHTSRSSMGNDVADFNNDGLPDIIVLDMLPDEQEILKRSGGEDEYTLFHLKLQYGYSHQYVRNTLQLNLGGGLFSEIGRLAGIHSTDWSWGPLFFDADNDGWKDLFIANGIYRRANDLDYIQFLTGGNRYFPVKDNTGVPDRVLYEKMPLYPNVNYIFRNNGDLTFTNMAGEWGFRERSYSNGAAWADLDNDGDADLVVNNINAPAYIMRNKAGRLTGNHYLSVAFRGRVLNTRGTGARVTLFCNGRTMMAEQFPTRGFMSATPDVLYFGLGRDTLVDSLHVRWPDLTGQVLTGIPADTMIVLEQENAVPIPAHGRSSTPPGCRSTGPVTGKRFARVEIPGLRFRHREDSYRDMERERLIPRELSAEGPALAKGDVNGDGLDDLFLGGARGQAAVILLQQADGSFRSTEQPVLLADRITEDVDAALFDADGDGDLDLYIVRGGNEFPAGDPLLADRLLLNDGNGNFSKSEPGSIPYMAQNGSCVRPADFDGDGDMDLFVGSRSVPGAYGLFPRQFLLVNNGAGVFTDAAEQLFEGGPPSGMITDGVWFDYDRDGDPDLAMCGEWMEIRLFRNDGGRFTEITGHTGLAGTSGWWSCIMAADVDGDGYPDLVAGNLGLNAMLRASGREPVEMYLNDFDNNGSPDPVICAYHNGKSYPVATLDELAAAIGGLRNKYPAYADFGGKTATDIFGQDKMEQSVQRTAVLFESSLFLNNGGSFYRKKLPDEAQFAPVRDILAEDLNGDGITDLLLAGNDYTIRPSLGRIDASYGWYLEGSPDNGFRVLMPFESGMTLRGDMRRIEMIGTQAGRLLIGAQNNGEILIFRVF